ncbi:unnamed protein product [Periconia digitata]|uniref:Uncharacterized protein n=1 Tax=Periconia digitata TaxID=1303443 RepID=A0A9W4XL79_9PLEO|nr:unnamed protein product [Periconia digitata]
MLLPVTFQLSQTIQPSSHSRRQIFIVANCLIYPVPETTRSIFFVIITADDHLNGHLGHRRHIERNTENILDIRSTFGPRLGVIDNGDMTGSTNTGRNDTLRIEI